jgi:membrane protease subunit HflK
MGRKVQTLLIAMGANVLLIGTKFLLASASGSLALKASAWHSFADLFVSAIVLGGLVVAARGPGGGSGRAGRIEHGVALFVAIFIFYMAYRIFAEVVGGHEHDLANVGWVAVGALVTIGFAYFMGRYKTYVGQQTGSPSLVADGVHSMMDVYSSSVVLAGLLGYLIGFRSLDRVAAVVVVLFILTAGTHIFSDALAGLREEGHLEHRFLRSLQPSRRMVALIGVGVALGYVLSGVYLVGPDEEAVVRRFGRRVSVGVSPGLHYRLPWPIESVTKIQVQSVRAISPPPLELLTGDENLISLRATVQYAVKDVAGYLFNVGEPGALIAANLEAAVRQTVGSRQIDDLLTTGRAEAEREAGVLLQGSLDRHGASVSVLTVRLVSVAPPAEVADAFLDVASAREDRATYINEAAAYGNEVVPKARGEAAKTLREGEAYRAEKVNVARGDAGRFRERLREYSRARSVTETRLYLEAMERVLARVKKFVIGPEIKEDSLDLWFVGEGTSPIQLPKFPPPEGSKP